MSKTSPAACPGVSFHHWPWVLCRDATARAPRRSPRRRTFQRGAGGRATRWATARLMSDRADKSGADRGGCRINFWPPAARLCARRVDFLPPARVRARFAQTRARRSCPSGPSASVASGHPRASCACRSSRSSLLAFPSPDASRWPEARVQASSAPAAALSSKSPLSPTAPRQSMTRMRRFWSCTGSPSPASTSGLAPPSRMTVPSTASRAQPPRGARRPCHRQVTELGDDDTLSDRNFKYLRGIRTAAGTILGIPAWAENVLEITLHGRGAHHRQAHHPADEHEALEVDVARAAGLDECIYGIPSNADGVLKINPHTREVTTFGADAIPPGQNRWYGGIRGPTGCITGCRTPPTVLKIVPGETRSAHDGRLLGRSRGWRWHGGVLAPDGCIYAFPSPRRVVRRSTASRHRHTHRPEFEEGTVGRRRGGTRRKRVRHALGHGLRASHSMRDGRGGRHRKGVLRI